MTTNPKYEPVCHDHQAFLAKAAQREGFQEAYDASASQLLAARTRAGLTQDTESSHCARSEGEVVIAHENVEQVIYLIRGQKVILDRDLARLYNVETKVLKQAVKRNIRRFPEDFSFTLSAEELSRWRSQFVTSNADRKGLRYAPMAFTEQGVAMLSGILNSERAIQVNIAIMRTFVKLRRLLEEHTTLSRKLAEIETKYDEQFQIVFKVLNELMSPPAPPRRQIGFHAKSGAAP